MKTPAALPSVLLVELNFVMRRTIASVAHNLGIACVSEAVGNDSARLLLASRCFDGVVIDLSSVPEPFDLLSQLRQGGFASDADAPIVALTVATTDAALDDRLRSLGRVSILRKPFKVAELLQMVQRMPVGMASIAQTA